SAHEVGGGAVEQDHRAAVVHGGQGRHAAAGSGLADLVGDERQRAVRAGVLDDLAVVVDEGDVLPVGAHGWRGARGRGGQRRRRVADQRVAAVGGGPQKDVAEDQAGAGGGAGEVVRPALVGDIGAVVADPGVSDDGGQ